MTKRAGHPPEDNRKQPEGLIRTFEVNGIVADVNGGWKCREEHTANEGHSKPQNGCSLETAAREPDEQAFRRQIREHCGNGNWNGEAAVAAAAKLRLIADKEIVQVYWNECCDA